MFNGKNKRNNLESSVKKLLLRKNEIITICIGRWN